MKTGIRFFLALAGCVVLLAGCDAALSSGGVKVSGTISGNYTSVQGNATISASSGSNNYSSSFPISAEDFNNGGYQSGPYTLTNVPKGTYQVVLTYNGYSGQATYSINGGQPVSVPAVQGPLVGNYYDWTITVNGVSIQGDTTVDIYLGNTG